MESASAQHENQTIKEEVSDFDEKLPDGTVHHTHTVRRVSITQINGAISCEIPVSENVIETFEEPAHEQCDEEDVDQVQRDGTTVHKRIITKRMVHHVRTHQESFDSDHVRTDVTDEEYDEVVPGTESTFVEGDDDSDSDEEEIADMMARSSLSPENQNGHSKADDQSALGEDEEVETHRLMMKKEVHKKTMIGPDGKEQTTVMEDSQIQQENEPPEELRDSMQEIINQFMESDPQPAQLPAPTQSKEEDV